MNIKEKLFVWTIFILSSIFVFNTLPESIDKEFSYIDSHKAETTK